MRMRARRSDGVLFHAGNAALAACTAASMSASLQNGTRRTTSPVAGLVTSPERVLDAACLRPFTHNGTFSMVCRSVGLCIKVYSAASGGASLPLAAQIQRLSGFSPPRIPTSVSSDVPHTACERSGLQAQADRVLQSILL